MHRFPLEGYTKQRRGCCKLHKRGRILANVKSKVVKQVTLVLGRFSIDFRKFKILKTFAASIQGEGVSAKASLLAA